jgi:Putative zinc-finger
MTETPDRPGAGHIPLEEIAAFLERLVSPRKKKEIIAHLEECPACRTLVAQVILSKPFVQDPNGDSD